MGDGAHFPLTSHQRGLKTTDPAWLRRHPQQLPRWHRILGTLDVHQLRLTQHRRTLNQARSRCTEHHPTRRRHRLHPLRHAHLLTNRGVTPSTRTDLTRNNLPGIEAYPQPQVNTVVALNLNRQPRDLVLNTERRQTGAHRVILQGRRCAKDGHDAVAGELVHRAAVVLHHRRSCG